MIHAARRLPAEPVCREMSAETMKIPEPIIEPTTIIVESNRLRPRTKPEPACAAGETAEVASDMSTLPYSKYPTWLLRNALAGCPETRSRKLEEPGKAKQAA